MFFNIFHKKQMRNTLNDKKEALSKAQVSFENEALRDLSKDGFDELSYDSDLGAQECQRTVDLELANLECDRLSEVEKALYRMGAKDFGRCSSCGESIPVARLLAVPETRFCKECEDARELSVKSSSTNSDKTPFNIRLEEEEELFSNSK